MGRIFQGVGEGDQDDLRIKGISTLFFIECNNFPINKAKEVKYARVACTIREIKTYKHRTRMTVGGNSIKYQGDIGTPTANFENVKLLFNSVLLRQIPNV